MPTGAADVPIYEFYCPDCHTVYSFFSSTIRPDASPDCPRCQRPKLARRPSRFAALRGKSTSESAGDGEPTGGEDSMIPGFDEARLGSAMEAMAGEMERMGDDAAEDPRQMARFFRRFGEVSGLELGPRMEEIVRRLESGEDPESFDAEMSGDEGDGGGGGEGGPGADDWSEFFVLKKKLLAAGRKPQVDETLYFL